MDIDKKGQKGKKFWARLTSTVTLKCSELRAQSLIPCQIAKIISTKNLLGNGSRCIVFEMFWSDNLSVIQLEPLVNVQHLGYIYISVAS